MTDHDTYTVTWSTDEGRFLKTVLRSAAESDTDLEAASEKYEQATGVEHEMVEATDEMVEDPPTPVDLLKNFEGDSDQQWVGTRTDYEALQTALTVYVTESAQSGQPIHEMAGVIDDIHTKIRRAYEALGGPTVGPDEKPY